MQEWRRCCLLFSPFSLHQHCEWTFCLCCREAGRPPQNAYPVAGVLCVSTSDEREIVWAAKRHASKTTRWMCSRNTSLFRCQRSASVSVRDWCGHYLRFKSLKHLIFFGQMSFLWGRRRHGKKHYMVCWSTCASVFSNTDILERVSIKKLPYIHEKTSR